MSDATKAVAKQGEAIAELVVKISKAMAADFRRFERMLAKGDTFKWEQAALVAKRVNAKQGDQPRRNSGTVTAEQFLNETHGEAYGMTVAKVQQLGRVWRAYGDKRIEVAGVELTFAGHIEAEKQSAEKLPLILEIAERDKLSIGAASKQYREANPTGTNAKPDPKPEGIRIPVTDKASRITRKQVTKTAAETVTKLATLPKLGELREAARSDNKAEQVASLRYTAQQLRDRAAKLVEQAAKLEAEAEQLAETIDAEAETAEAA